MAREPRQMLGQAAGVPLAVPAPTRIAVLIPCYNEAEVHVLVDGDGTYDASSAAAMVEPPSAIHWTW